MVKSMRPGCHGEDLDPRMRMMDDLNRAKLRRHHRSPIKTFTSNNALSNLPPQNPLAATSSLVLSSLLAVRRESDSPLSGWRWGSMETSWQTSVRRLASRSRTSLCLMMVNPPVGQAAGTFCRQMGGGGCPVVA